MPAKTGMKISVRPWRNPGSRCPAAISSLRSTVSPPRGNAAERADEETDERAEERRAAEKRAAEEQKAADKKAAAERKVEKERADEAVKEQAQREAETEAVEAQEAARDPWLGKWTRFRKATRDISQWSENQDIPATAVRSAPFYFRWPPV